MHSGYLWFIVAYLVVVVAYGLYISKKLVKTSEGFVTAGRSLPLWIVIGTLIATWFGGGSITGCANIVYSRGILAGLIYQYSTPIGLLVVFLIAGKIRAAENTTIPALFKDKYGSQYLSHRFHRPVLYRHHVISVQGCRLRHQYRDRAAR